MGVILRRDIEWHPTDVGLAIQNAVIPHEDDCNDPSVFFTAFDELDEDTANLLVYCTECGAARYIGTFQNGVAL
jgi:hypothetical protein